MLRGKSVVVTGAGRGIGRAAAIACATHGAKVVVNDVDGSEADSVVAEIRAGSGIAVASHHSVSDGTQVQAMIDLCVSEFGRVDGLVNNAGVLNPSREAWEVLPEEIGRVVDVNVKGALQAGVAALAEMHRQRSGVIVNVTSRAHVGDQGVAIYGASKGAVASATYGWAVDMAPYGVRVMGFVPVAQTRISRPGDRPDPADVVPVIVYLLSDRSEGMSGQIVHFDGRKLSLMSPPTFGGPAVEAPDLLAEDIAEYMSGELRDAISTIGWKPYDLR